MNLVWALGAGLLVAAPIMALPTRAPADPDPATARLLIRENGRGPMIVARLERASLRSDAAHGSNDQAPSRAIALSL